MSRGVLNGPNFVYKFLNLNHKTPKSHTKTIVALFILQFWLKKCPNVFSDLIWRGFGIKHQNWKLCVPSVK